MQGRTLAAVAAALTLALGACASTSSKALPPPVHKPTTPASSTAPPGPTVPPSPSPGPLKPIADEGQVTYSVTLTAGECRARDGGKLPDPSCTPGSVDPKVTQATIHATICVQGWTSTIRPPVYQTSRAKFEVAYPAYGITQGTVSELDHLVPLELGGSNDITNLWPQVGHVPNPKDDVENLLRERVCAGTLTLAAARAEIAADWETVK